MDPAMQYLLLCFATAACAITVAKPGKIAQSLHNLAERMGQVWLQDLLSCPSCLVFLFGLFFVLLTGTGGSLLGVVFLVAAVAAGAVIVMGVMLRLHFMHERELHGVRERLSEANEALANAEFELREAKVGEGKALELEALLRGDLARLQTASTILLKENARLRQSVWDAERERALGKDPQRYTLMDGELVPQKTQGRLNHERHFGPSVVGTPEIVPDPVPANGFTPPRPMPPAPAPQGWAPMPEGLDVSEVWPDNPPEVGSAP
jgi:hypothetical protein